MRILYISKFKYPDYQNDMIFHGLKSVFQKDVYESDHAAYMYKDFSNLQSLYGRGFTTYGKLDNSLSNVADDIKDKIRHKFFDKVIYGSIQRCEDYFEDVVTSYGKDDVIFIDGEDDNSILSKSLKHGRYFKRELSSTSTDVTPRIVKAVKDNKLSLSADNQTFGDTARGIPKKLFVEYRIGNRKARREVYEGETLEIAAPADEKLVIDKAHYTLVGNIFPINFCIPKALIVKKIPQKRQLYSNSIPGRGYIFDNEQDYYDDYRKSYFGLTHKKGGWDCCRHYEILMNGCIPYFPNLSDCPPLTMAKFPKDIILEANNMWGQDANPEEIKSSKEYIGLVDLLLEYTRNNLTTEAEVAYVLNPSIASCIK